MKRSDTTNSNKSVVRLWQVKTALDSVSEEINGLAQAQMIAAKVGWSYIQCSLDTYDDGITLEPDMVYYRCQNGDTSKREDP